MRMRPIWIGDHSTTTTTTSHLLLSLSNNIALHHFQSDRPCLYHYVDAFLTRQPFPAILYPLSLIDTKRRDHVPGELPISAQLVKVHAST
jgi:hypothetical protein